MTTPTPALSTKDVAEKLGTDAKTLRTFLRATQKGVGSGKRYELTAKDVSSLRAQFKKWAEAKRSA